MSVPKSWADIGIESLPIDLKEEKIGKAASLISAPVKGFARAVEKTFGFESPLDAVKRLQKGIPTRSEEVEVGLKKLLPTREAGEEKILERFGGAAGIPIPGMGPLAQALRAAGASLLEQTTEEMGGGPIAQALSGLPAWMVPRLGFQTPGIHEDARALGLSEETLTRSTQARGKVATLAPFSLKGQRATQAMRETQDELGAVYRTMRASPEARQIVDPDIVRGMMQEWTFVLEDMPASVRNIARADFEQLLSQPVTGDSLMRFWAQINQNFRGRGSDLQRLKGPILDSIYATNPELGQRFEIWNQLYGNFANLRGSLTPHLRDDILMVAEGIPVIQAAASGSPSRFFEAIKALGWVVGGRKLAQEMLISPRLQGIARKFLQSAPSGAIGATLRLGKAFKKEAEQELNVREGVTLPKVMTFPD